MSEDYPNAVHRCPVLSHTWNESDARVWLGVRDESTSVCRGGGERHQHLSFVFLYIIPSQMLLLLMLLSRKPLSCGAPLPPSQ
jgi:hypothetical protein